MGTDHNPLQSRIVMGLHFFCYRCDTIVGGRFQAILAALFNSASSTRLACWSVGRSIAKDGKKTEYVICGR